MQQEDAAVPAATTTTTNPAEPDHPPQYKYAKGMSARAPFMFAQRNTSIADLSSTGADSPVPPSNLSAAQIQQLVDPIVAAMKTTTFYDIMGTSTLVVVLDINSTVGVCVAAAQETKATSFLIWDPFVKETGMGKFVAILTLTNFIQILIHCHENADQVAKLSNMPLRELITMTFAKVMRSSILHSAPEISLYDLLGMMVQNAVNHVPIYGDSAPSATPSTSGGSNAPTSLLGVAFLPQLLSQVVRIINNPGVTIAAGTPRSSSGGGTASATGGASGGGGGSPYSSLFEVPLSLLPGIGNKLNSKDVDGAASWLRSEETVYVALKRLIDYGVQALPIINEHGAIVDTFSRSDVIGLEDLGVYNLNQSVKQALARVKHRSIVVCQMSDTIGDVVAHFVASGVRTIFVVQNEEFVGQIQVGDLLSFLFKSSTPGM